MDLRRLLFVSAYQVYRSTLHGCGAPITGMLRDALTKPEPGHLVMEITTIYMPERDAFRFGRLLRRAYEPSWTAEQWADPEVNAHPEAPRPTTLIWYVALEDGTEYRWDNADFIRVFERSRSVGSYFVLQPNGLLARFSSIVDNFTHVNLTKEEAIEVVVQGETERIRQLAEEMVERGMKDELPHTNRLYGDGSARWRDTTKTVRVCHGAEELRRVLELVSRGKPAKP